MNHLSDLQVGDYVYVELTISVRIATSLLANTYGKVTQIIQVGPTIHGWVKFEYMVEFKTGKGTTDKARFERNWLTKVTQEEIMKHLLEQ